MNLSRRILTQIAIAVVIVILVGTGVTYLMLFRAAEHAALRHLSNYDSERTAAEEAEFLRVEENLKMVRDLLVRRDIAGARSNVDAQWDERYELHADGAWRTRREFSDGRKFCSGWVRKDAPLNLSLKTRIVRAENILNDFLLGWVDTFPSLYFIFPEQVKVGFDPRIPNWGWEAKADYDACAAAFFENAAPEKNPARGFVWGAAVREPVSQQPYVSVTLPVYKENEFIGIAGHDIAVRELQARTTREGLRGVQHFIVRTDGRLIAHPGLEREILASDGQFRLQASGDARLESLHGVLAAMSGKHQEGHDAASDLHYTATRLRGPGWLFVSTLPRAELRRGAFGSAQWVLWSGLASLVVLLAVFAAILRRQIARPLAELIRATHQMRGGDLTARADVPRKDELGALASAFNDMASAESERDAVLERLVTERTAELTEANARLADAGNEALRSLAREKELGEMKSRFVSTVSHEFRNPLAIILSCSDVLQRMSDKLPEELRREQITGIQTSVRRMADMMEEVLLLGRAEAGRLVFEPEDMDLAVFSRRITDQMISATAQRCPVHLHAPEHFPARADRSLLEHILHNLLSNAVKYSPPGSPVTFQLERDGSAAVLTVTDHGSGIPAADMDKLYEPFHRGSNAGAIPGTGLGLVIVKRCVEAHSGSIRCESSEGRGTNFTVTLPVAAP
ncbi:MAG: ATP-binding protein [Verrucomicrobiales bacterium]